MRGAPAGPHSLDPPASHLQPRLLVAAVERAVRHLAQHRGERAEVQLGAGVRGGAVRRERRSSTGMGSRSPARVPL
jgi:hypothetical protein